MIFRGQCLPRVEYKVESAREHFRVPGSLFLGLSSENRARARTSAIQDFRVNLPPSIPTAPFAHTWGGCGPKDRIFLKVVENDFSLESKEEVGQFGVYLRMPIDNAELASADYWNHRYEEVGVEDAYDWFRDWEQLGAWFTDHLSQPHAKILHLGCGNSVSLPCLIWVLTRKNVTSVIICCGEGTGQCH